MILTLNISLYQLYYNYVQHVEDGHNANAAKEGAEEQESDENPFGDRDDDKSDNVQQLYTEDRITPRQP